MGIDQLLRVGPALQFDRWVPTGAQNGHDVQRGFYRAVGLIEEKAGGLCSGALETPGAVFTAAHAPTTNLAFQPAQLERRRLGSHE